jgi:hypothetical protein
LSLQNLFPSVVYDFTPITSSKNPITGATHFIIYLSRIASRMPPVCALDRLSGLCRVIRSDKRLGKDPPVVATEGIVISLAGLIDEAGVAVVEMGMFGPAHKDTWIVLILLTKVLAGISIPTVDSESLGVPEISSQLIMRSD